MTAAEVQPITDDALRQAIDQSHHVDRDPGEPSGPFYLALVACQARIAALEATVARLTAPVTPAEVVAFARDRYITEADGGGNMGALTAFLERRMKGC